MAQSMGSSVREETSGADSDRRSPFVIGIVGASGSGKHTVAEGLRALLGGDRVTDLRLDDYHRYTREERAERGLTALNPLVHDLSLMQEHLQLLRAGRPVRNRSYRHEDGSFGPIRSIEPADVVLARGLFGFPTDALHACYDLSIFLAPEPELLFRWKLRRDVQERGYAEAQVLKHIAQHLLDAKQYVLPQEERADMVVRYRVPDWDAPDEAIQTTILLRRSAAELIGSNGLLGGLAGRAEMEWEGEELTISLPSDLPDGMVERWGRALFPGRFDLPRLGRCLCDASQESAVRSHLVVVQAVAASIAEQLHRPVSV
jgi:uridine kinase